MFKKILAFSLCLICLSGTLSTVVSAQSINQNVVIQWITLQKITLGMTYSSGKVIWQGQLRGTANTANITATFTLEEWNSATSSYDLVATSSTLMSNSMILNYSNSTTAPKGTYRLSVTATIINTSGVSETVYDTLVKTFT